VGMVVVHGAGILSADIGVSGLGGYLASRYRDADSGPPGLSAAPKRCRATRARRVLAELAQSGQHNNRAIDTGSFDALSFYGVWGHWGQAAASSMGLAPGRHLFPWGVPQQATTIRTVSHSVSTKAELPRVGASV